MKRISLQLFFPFLIIQGINAQNISLYLFGQNHWMADSDEGNRDDVYKDAIQPRATQVLIFDGDEITKIN